MADTFVPSETDWAYFAGMIDGEGHVGLYRHRDKKCKRGYSYRVVLGITNTQIPLLLDLQRRFGGIVHEQGKSGFSDKPVFGLRFSANAMRDILPRVLPYIVLKKKDLEIMLRAMKITDRHRYKDYDDSPLEPLITEINQIRKERRAS